jgi:glycosyltransferase involved in cell wall biosynthesis
MRVLLWHVHGSWTTAFVHGRHEYVVPVTPQRDADGLGRAATYAWPERVAEVTPEELRATPLDVVVLQRPHELELVARWLGRIPGRDLPAVYVEHNTPKGLATTTRHPLANQTVVPLVHVTAFNEVFWDNGRAPTVVIEHGIVDPGERWTGELAQAAVVINEPVRRGRIVGADLLRGFSAAAPLDVYGMGLDGLHAAYGCPPDRVHLHADLTQDALHDEMARRRVYLHPIRWTSLGLTLLEAMHLGMPVVALATTEVVEAVPPAAGCLSTNPRRLAEVIRVLVNDHGAARHAGRTARQAVLARYGLARFLDDWDRLLKEVTR